MNTHTNKSWGDSIRSQGWGGRASYSNLSTALDVGVNRPCRHGYCHVGGWCVRPGAPRQQMLAFFVDIYHPQQAGPAACLLSAVSKSPHTAQHDSMRHSATRSTLTLITDILQLFHIRRCPSIKKQVILDISWRYIGWESGSI